MGNDFLVKKKMKKSLELFEAVPGNAGVILVKIKIKILAKIKIKMKKSLELFEAVPGNAGVIHREDCLSKTEHGGETLQTNVYLI